MTFGEQLELYMKSIGISGKELAELSEISPSLVSRYRKGERTPSAESRQIEKLAKGIVRAAKEKGIEIVESEILQNLKETIETPTSYDIAEQLNELILALDINVSKMAQSIHYDPSYLSKIRQRKRRPSDRDQFCQDISGYVAEHYLDNNSISILAELLSCDAAEINREESLIEKLTEWMHTQKKDQQDKKDYMDRFLEKMDEFDLQEYISAIQFDKLKVPTVPFQLPSSKHYYGLAEMREGEIDFLKAVVLSKSMEPLMICNDMPVEDMAEDNEFAKKYMFGLAMVLKKGLQIHIIHNVDRPMADMVLGMENWIPLYMTGQITPRYLKGGQNQVYQHLHYCAGNVAMMGECISGSHDKGHYYRTNNKDEVQWMKEYMKDLFRKSDPLMDIYTEAQEDKLMQFLKNDRRNQGVRKRILNSPPIFVLSPDEFKKILRKKELSADSVAEVMRIFEEHKENLETLLQNHVINDAVIILNEEDYRNNPVWATLPGRFLREKIQLTYEEYLYCMEKAKAYEEEHSNYHLMLNKSKGFHNIQITIHEGKWCMISKGKSPMIHFVVRHPKLRYAFENMWIPITEEEDK